MKYLFSILLFLLSIIIFFIFNLKGIIIWQSFLIFSVLLCLIINDYKVYYFFSIISGLFIDSFTEIFGLHTIIFLLIIFILDILKNELLSFKNILSILLLIFVSFFLYYLFIYLFYLIIGDIEYFYNIYSIFFIIKSLFINISLTIIFYLIYFNFTKNERSF